MVKQFNERRNNAVRRVSKKTESSSEQEYEFIVDAVVTASINARSFQEAKEIMEQRFMSGNPYVNYIENTDTGEVWGEEDINRY